MNELTSVFISICESLLKEPNIPPHSFAIAKDKESAFVDFPALNKSGYDVDIAVNAVGIILGGGDLWHRHLQLENGAGALVEEAFGHARTLLCPDARLIEMYSNSKVYSATIEEFDGDNWIRGDSISLYFWNYFGKRSKKVLINDHLPGRIVA